MEPSVAPALPASEQVRRRFATGWASMGVAWGVPPSTAAVHGYLLLAATPLAESEIRAALGLSGRAVRVAIADCVAWGIVERAPERRRAGTRGPAGVGWQAVVDHWEWFRRVVAARKEREADPVIAVIEGCLVEAGEAQGRDPDVDAVRTRLESLVAFVNQFEPAISVVERADARALERLFVVLGRLEPATLDRLVDVVGESREDELVRFATTVASLSPAALRRLLRLAADPRLGRLLAGRR